MTAVSTQQWWPISTSETGEDDPLCTRTLYDLQCGINNYRNYVYRGHKVISQICTCPDGAWWKASTTTQQVIWLSAPRYIPQGYTSITVAATHKLGTGSSLYWVLIASARPFRGPAFEGSTLADYFPSGYTYVQWESSSSSCTRTVTTGLTIPTLGDDRLLYFTLSASAGTGNESAYLYTLDGILVP